MMKKNAISKINQMGQVGGYLTLIAKIIVILGIILCLAGAVIFTIIPENFVSVKVSENALVDVNLSSLGLSLTEEDIRMIQEDSFQEATSTDAYDVNGVNYHLQDMLATKDSMQINAVAENFTLSLKSLTWVFLAGALNIVMALVTLFFVGALCKAFRYCESPFEENVIKKMQNLAISLIPWTIISSMAESFVANLLNVGSFEFGISVDFNVVLVIVLIFVLVYIFKYGAVLQRESDETL